MTIRDDHGINPMQFMQAGPSPKAPKAPEAPAKRIIDPVEVATALKNVDGMKEDIRIMRRALCGEIQGIGLDPVSRDVYIRTNAGVHRLNSMTAAVSVIPEFLEKVIAACEVEMDKAAKALSDDLLELAVEYRK